MSVQVDVSKPALDQVRELIRSQTPGTGVRVYLEPGGEGGGCGCGGGGCGCGEGDGPGGPRFGMAFDSERPGDQVIRVDGLSLFVDDLSAEMLEGASIDYVETLEATGFKISAPKLNALRAPGAEAMPDAEAGGGCGCGGGGCGCNS